MSILKIKLFTISILFLSTSCDVKNKTINKKKRPNIILIMSDDMGYSDIAPYGGEINTPNLSSLAQNGLKFTQFYNSARCSATRASLLTGTYPHEAGIKLKRRYNSRSFKRVWFFNNDKWKMAIEFF